MNTQTPHISSFSNWAAIVLLVPADPGKVELSAADGEGVGIAASVLFKAMLLGEVFVTPPDVIDLTVVGESSWSLLATGVSIFLYSIRYGLTSTFGGGAIDENKSLTNGEASNSSMLPLL